LLLNTVHKVLKLTLGGNSMVSLLVSLFCIQDALKWTASELEDVMYMLMSERSTSEGRPMLLANICTHAREAAAQLSADATGQLLVHAASLGEMAALKALYTSLPAAESLSHPMLISLFLQAAESGILYKEHKIILALCLPALRQADAAVAERLLSKVMDSEEDMLIVELIALMPAAKQLDAAAVGKLLALGLKRSKAESLKQMHDVIPPGEQQIGHEELAPLMKQAIETWRPELDPGILQGLIPKDENKPTFEEVLSLAGSVSFQREVDLYKDLYDEEDYDYPSDFFESDDEAVH
jgi:hypothetical protein